MPLTQAAALEPDHPSSVPYDAAWSLVNTRKYAILRTLATFSPHPMSSWEVTAWIWHHMLPEERSATRIGIQWRRCTRSLDRLAQTKRQAKTTPTVYAIKPYVRRVECYDSRIGRRCPGFRLTPKGRRVADKIYEGQLRGRTLLSERLDATHAEQDELE